MNGYDIVIFQVNTISIVLLYITIVIFKKNIFFCDRYYMGPTIEGALYFLTRTYPRSQRSTIRTIVFVKRCCPMFENRINYVLSLTRPTAFETVLRFVCLKKV